MKNYFYHKTRICTECGEEVERGIINTVEHADICKRNAPNMCVDSYRFINSKKERQGKTNYEFKRKFDKAWRKMTDDEQNEVIMLSFCGFWDGNAVFMGSEAFENLFNFKRKMIEKYN